MRTGIGGRGAGLKHQKCITFPENHELNDCPGLRYREARPEINYKLQASVMYLTPDTLPGPRCRFLPEANGDTVSNRDKEEGGERTSVRRRGKRRKESFGFDIQASLQSDHGRKKKKTKNKSES